jgi:hypothetical protein
MRRVRSIPLLIALSAFLFRSDLLTARRKDAAKPPRNKTLTKRLGLGSKREDSVAEEPGKADFCRAAGEFRVFRTLGE